MVVMSLEKYSKLMKDTEYSEYIENELDEADREAEDINTKYYKQIYIIFKSFVTTITKLDKTIKYTYNVTR